MPQALNNVRGEQWEHCTRCDRLWPMSQLQKQKGMLLCSQDLDDLTIERAPGVIARTLRDNPLSPEGSDRRVQERLNQPVMETEVY